MTPYARPAPVSARSCPLPGVPRSRKLAFRQPLLGALAVLVLGLLTPAKADEWTKTDTAFQLTVATLQVIDLMQTRSFLGRCETIVTPAATRCIGSTEGNPVLGPNPSRLKLDVMVAGAIVGHAAISYLLPQPWRRVWQVVVISVEVTMVTRTTIVTGGFRLELP